MANNLITSVEVTCGNLRCHDTWMVGSEYMENRINLCPFCGWDSGGDKYLIEEYLRKEGLTNAT